MNLRSLICIAKLYMMACLLEHVSLIIIIPYDSLLVSTFFIVSCYSGSGMGNVIEPISAVQLNDELLGAKASVADAEAEILLEITEKVVQALLCLWCLIIVDLTGKGDMELCPIAQIKVDLEGIEKMLKNVIALDVVSIVPCHSLSIILNFPMFHDFEVLWQTCF